MNSVKTWVDNNIDRKQMTTIVAASVVIGAAAYAARAAGLGKVSTVVKGG